MLSQRSAFLAALALMAGACSGSVILGGAESPDASLPDATSAQDAGAQGLDAGYDAVDAADATDATDEDARRCTPIDAGSPPVNDAGDACAADLLHDPENCGACGRDCMGGFCDLGSAICPKFSRRINHNRSPSCWKTTCSTGQTSPATHPGRVRS